jgi:hypothetical protein
MLRGCTLRGCTSVPAEFGDLAKLLLGARHRAAGIDAFSALPQIGEVGFRSRVS